MKEEILLLNTIILSMATKQKVLDDLKSNIFTVNVYSEYIEDLIYLLLSLNGSPEKKEIYEQNIKKYLEGEIAIPEKVLEI